MTEAVIRIFDIQRFSIHDGPGIRTTVFFNGCPLHCPWCSNPESQKGRVELMHFERKCTRCGRCFQACPNGAIRFSPETGPVIDRSKCQRCGSCARACLSGAMRMTGKEVSVEEVMKIVRRDVNYYRNRGGGMTVSGGEPFLQPEGLAALLQAARDEGITTAIETTGNVSFEAFQKANGLVDTWLFDLKHADPEKLKEVIGGNLPLIQENLKQALAEKNSQVIIRVPVIPGFNFDEESLTWIFRLALSCGARQVDLLPYHVLGKSKYVQLGRAYEQEGDKGLDKKELIPFALIGQAMGLEITISGKNPADLGG
ncbi:MAG: glycyl-radical enzyme activating protein [Firmicutes bacterium]|nr:glycyl-radical enzyme activating protein [Bacillota bacterium]